MRTPLLLNAFLALSLGVVSAITPGYADEKKSTVIRIGILPSMLRGGAKPAMGAAIKEPLLTEVESQTGLDCKFAPMLTLNEMRRQLTSGRLHFALCHGFEFAWMRLKQPDLKAMMVAVPVTRPLKAFVIVVDSSPVKSLCDLQGKVVAVPKGSHATVRLFADRECRCENKPPAEFAKTITKPDTAETALHELFDDKIQAAIVDSAAMLCFAERYPAQYKLIRTIAESESFPLSVIVTRERAVDPAILRRFQDAMEKAHTKPRGRQLMSLIQTAGFETVPVDHDQQLAEFVKRYPPPAEAAKEGNQ